MDRTQPPPGFVPYIDGTFIIQEANEMAHWIDGWEGHTLEEAWDYYDRITLPARVALLRELAAELLAKEQMLGGDMTMKMTFGAIGMELRDRAAALEAKG